MTRIKKERKKKQSTNKRRKIISHNIHSILNNKAEIENRLAWSAVLTTLDITCVQGGRKSKRSNFLAVAVATMNDVRIIINSVMIASYYSRLTCNWPYHTRKGVFSFSHDAYLQQKVRKE